MMSRFFRQQATINIRQLTVRQIKRQGPHSFAATRFNQSGDEHYIECTLRLITSHQSVQFSAIGAGGQTAVNDPALIKHRQNLLKMRELFSCELRQGRLDEAMMRIREEQLHRRPSGFFFAMSVIDEDLIHVRRDPVHPRCIGLIDEVQHALKPFAPHRPKYLGGASARPALSASRWHPQRDSNPCRQLERLVS